MLICSCYLPAENSPWGRDSESLFAYMLNFIYTKDAEHVLICGDFNSRIGSLNDVIDNIDCVRKRADIDFHVNQHGRSMIEFLQQARFCVLNGRFCTNENDFTCKTTRWCSVVDYMLVPHSNLDLYKQFKVISCNDLIEQFDLFHLLHDKSKIPDHNILSVLFTFKHKCNYESINTQAVNNRSHYTVQVLVKYNFDNPGEFMKNNNIKKKLDNLGLAINSDIHISEHLDKHYDLFKLCIFEEMEKYLPQCGRSFHSTNSKQKSKPFWNSTLGNLWKVMRENEKLLRHSKNYMHKQFLYNQFIVSRTNFDKKFSFYHKEYEKGKMVNIETLNVSNAKEFWKQLKKLGPKNLMEKL